jgi:hypothetical protein
MENESLLSLTAEFFESRGYVIEHDLKYMGFSGLFHTFDLLARKGKEEHAILVVDWNKTVGIDTVIKADQATADVELAHLIIVARKFSDHAQAYSNKKRIMLMTERELLYKLGKTNKI